MSKTTKVEPFVKQFFFPIVGYVVAKGVLWYDGLAIASLDDGTMELQSG